MVLAILDLIPFLAVATSNLTLHEARPAEPAMSNKPKRRWYQFSLKALLCLMLVVGCGLGWFTYHLRLARNRQIAIAECEKEGMYVYQYESTALGKMLRQWPSLDKQVQAKFGDSMLSSPSAVSALAVSKERAEFIGARLKLFPSLKSISLGNTDKETAMAIRKEFPDVAVVQGFYK